MNELAWKMLGVFYNSYEKTHSLLDTYVDREALKKALGLSAKDIEDTALRLMRDHYLEGSSNGCWKLTGDGLAAFEERQPVASPPIGRSTKGTMFVEAMSIDELQKEVNRREAEGWAFVSLSVAIAVAPVLDPAEGSSAVVLQDVGLTAPRLYVAALRQ